MRAAKRRRSSQETTPRTIASPLVGWSIPVSILIEVDFPAPFGPM